MKTIVNPKQSTWSTILKRPTVNTDDLETTVRQVFNDIKRNGDAAVQKYTAMFDGYQTTKSKVALEEIEKAVQKVSSDLKAAIALAKSNIETFHKAQKTAAVYKETMPGVLCWQEKRPIENVGLYIPGGTAPLFSTVLMLAIPASLAGCKNIVLCTPPNEEGKIANEILYAAKLCGVTEIYKVGGIQAIAAMTFGTIEIPKVYKIFGPGNQFVTAAKQFATKFGVAIDMPAGPSELMVVADKTANPKYVASDLLSQAEHGADSQVILISNSEEMMNTTLLEITNQLNELPRKQIAEKAIENSKAILIDGNDETLAMINEYGPEHLILCTQNNDFYIQNVMNAGSVFIGNYTPESAGDYASGTNHTLPTNGYSKAYSGVNLDSFTKSITFQKISKEGITNIGKSIELMAEAEGLQAHKNAVTIRLNDIKNEA